MNKTAILNVLNGDASNDDKASAIVNLATTQFEQAIGAEPPIGDQVILENYMEGWNHGWDGRAKKARERFYAVSAEQGEPK